MTKRMGPVALSGLAALALAVLLSATAFVFPAASPVGSAAGDRVPTSALEPLPEYVRDQVIDVHYEANGTAGQSGVFWVELYYRRPEMKDWALYAPPWNPSGRWFGALGFDAAGLVRGVIPFDTYFTGGEGVYAFSTVAVDRGYKSEAAPTQPKAHTTLDTHPPSLFIARPTPDSWTKDGILSWVAQDDVSGVGRVNATLTNDTVENLGVVDTPAAVGSAEMPLVGEGDYSLLVRAKDRAGNEAVLPVAFHYDPKAPTLAITAPAADTYVNSRDLTATWTAEDAGAGLASLQLTLDAAPKVDLPTDATSYGLAGLSERGHVLSLVATDGAGNLAVQSVPFGVDVTPPDLSVVSPADGTYVTARQLQVLWTGSDGGSGIDRFELSLDSGSPVKIASAAGYSFPSVAEGERILHIKAFDRAGNVNEKTIKVTVDATPPTVSISAPEKGATVYGTLQVNWSASDTGSGIARIDFLYDGGAPIVATGAVNHRIDTPETGPHFVTVRVTDRAGNVAEASLPFLYGGATPTGPGESGVGAWDVWLILLVLGVITAVSAYFAVRRSKKQKA